MEANPNPNTKMFEEPTAADWSAIPCDLFWLIVGKLNLTEDYVSFFSVCRAWYLFAKNQKRLYFSTSPSPFLMLRDSKSKSCTFHNYVSGKKFAVHLPEATGRRSRCWGSPFGWLITFNVTNLKLSMVHPFSRVTIPLPSLRTLLPSLVGDEYRNPNRLLRGFIKPILTSAPNSPDCLVMLLTKPPSDDFVLGFAKPGRDNAWSRVDGPSNLKLTLNDIIYFNGNLYGCGRDHSRRRTQDKRAHMDFVLIQPSSRRAVEFPAAEEIDGEEDDDLHDEFDRSLDNRQEECFFTDLKVRKYLVDLSGQLCLVLRYIVPFQNITVHFKVYKMNMDTKRWTRIWWLGDQCLFIGNNYTFACKATAPYKVEHFACRKDIASLKAYPFTNNLIYYSHDDDLSPRCRGSDHGVFDIWTCTEVLRKDISIVHPPVWITPSLHFHSLEEFYEARRCKLRGCSCQQHKLLNNEERKNTKDTEKEEKNFMACKVSKPGFLLHCRKRKRLHSEKAAAEPHVGG